MVQQIPGLQHLARAKGTGDMYLCEDLVTSFDLRPGSSDRRMPGKMTEEIHRVMEGMIFVKSPRKIILEDL